MIHGHGDDLYKYNEEIIHNFSSNIPQYMKSGGLYSHLARHISTICKYPEPDCHTLAQAIVHHNGTSEKRILVTSGATEAIYLIAQTFADSISQIFEPTFSEYYDACSINRHKTIRTTLTESENFAHSAQEIKISEKAHLIWLCNPNNPTGRVIDQELLIQTIKNYPNKLFIIDHSYKHFSIKKVITDLEAATYPNLIILNSLTKRFAIPGLRVGYISASPEIIQKIGKYKMPWSVNGLAIEAGLFLYSKTPRYPLGRTGVKSTLPITRLIRERENLTEELSKIAGIKIFPTDTHFFLCKSDNISAPELKKKLIDQYGILIRDASNFYGLDSQYIRIATQLNIANIALIQGIKWITQQSSSQ